MTEHCDYLIIGGGSAGCVLARRLAEKTTGRIIVLEAGKSDEHDPAANDLFLLDDQTTDYDWGFLASTLAGRAPELNYNRAKILGGCANHNDCAFLVPPPSDFDHWAALGAKGWSAVEVAPYFARIAGQVTVELAPAHPASRAFIEAGKERGLPEVDFRDAVVPGVGLFPLNAKGRLRQSSSIAHLHPLSALPKHLEIWTGTFASKLLFDGRRVIGAETSRGPVHARRAVILACGAIQTPQLMMVSGFGPHAQLRRHGIAVLADLPGVGQHLLDHVSAPVVWATREPVGHWQVCPFEATMLLQLDEQAPAPDVLFHFGLRVREKYGEHPRLAVGVPAVKASPNVARARSEGEVRLSTPDMRDKPVIDLNYFSDPDGYDIGLLIRAMRFTRELGHTSAMQLLCSAELRPGPDVETDADWRAYIEDVCETVYHPSGTCRMGDPQNPMSVCGPDLKVKDVDSLYVADASVFPSMVTVNINAAVMMIAEKAADLIAQRESKGCDA
jgi:choline dehydrogenase-like flavoprotein